MSLLSLLQDRKKHLNKTVTTVTKIGGEKYIESVEGEEIERLQERQAGYIVDSKPDFQVANILQYLALGSQDVATDCSLMLRENITHILSIGVEPNVKFENFDYKFVDLYDTPEESILNILSFTNDLIKIVGNIPGKKVFVHCNAGCSRAPSIVIGYLMFAYDMSYSDAYSKVRSVRYIRPNDGFVTQLKNYESELKVGSSRS